MMTSFNMILSLKIINAYYMLYVFIQSVMSRNIMGINTTIRNIIYIDTIIFLK